MQVFLIGSFWYFLLVWLIASLISRIVSFYFEIPTKASYFALFLVSVISYIIYILFIYLDLTLQDFKNLESIGIKISVVGAISAFVGWYLQLVLNYHEQVFKFGYTEISNFERAYLQSVGGLRSIAEQIAWTAEEQNMDADQFAWHLFFADAFFMSDDQTQVELRKRYYYGANDLVIDVSNYCWLIENNYVDKHVAKRLSIHIVRGFIERYLPFAIAYSVARSELSTLFSVARKWQIIKKAAIKSKIKSLRRQLKQLESDKGNSSLLESIKRQLIALVREIRNTVTGQRNMGQPSSFSFISVQK